MFFIQELRGNIRVHCRVRPVLSFDHEPQSGYKYVIRICQYIVAAKCIYHMHWNMEAYGNTLVFTSFHFQGNRMCPNLGWCKLNNGQAHLVVILSLNHVCILIATLYFAGNSQYTANQILRLRTSAVWETVWIWKVRFSSMLYVKHWDFAFNNLTCRVYGPCDAQQSVFSEVQPLITSLLDG